MPTNSRATPNKRRLNQTSVERIKPDADSTFLIWDTQQHGLALQVRPSGGKTYKVIYSHRGRPRWYHLGNARAIKLTDARKLAGRIMVQVAEGKDPQAERVAQRDKGSFEDLAKRYVEYAKTKNKSWMQPQTLVERFLIPKWGKLNASAITRADVKVMKATITSNSVANQTLAAASAIFAWAIREEILKANPCALVEHHEMKSRERVLADSELPQFWRAFDDAGLYGGTLLKLTLLLGQRPGEVSHMQREQIIDGWWHLPGAPDPVTGWPGTKNKNSHRVWLPKPALALLADLPEDGPLSCSASPPCWYCVAVVSMMSTSPTWRSWRWPV